MALLLWVSWLLASGDMILALGLCRFFCVVFYSLDILVAAFLWCAFVCLLVSDFSFDERNHPRVSINGRRNNWTSEHFVGHSGVRF